MAPAKRSLRLAVLYAVLCSPSNVSQSVAVYPEPVDAGIRRVPVVTLDSQLYHVVCDGVLHTADVGHLRVFHGEVLYSGAVRVVRVVAEEMRLGVLFAMETLDLF